MRSYTMSPPARKTNRSNRIISFLIALCIHGAYLHTKDLRQVIFMMAAIVLSNAVMEITVRIGMLYQELDYFESHYDRKSELLRRSVLLFTPTSLFSGIAALGGVYWMRESQPTESSFYIFLASAVYVLQPLLQFKSAPIYKAHQIAADALDVGTYMSISYFHGDLKLPLQKQPDSGRGLQHAMEVYEANNGITFMRKALYILVPKSMHCPHRLTDNSAIMEEAKTLDPSELDIGGMMNCNHENSVYKIRDRDGLIYVVAEYASPLRIFNEGANTDGHFKGPSDCVITCNQVK